MNFQDFLNTEIVEGTTIGDIFTVEFIASLLGDVVFAILPLVAAFVIAGWVNRRITRLGHKNRHLDETPFDFLGNIARWVVLGFAALFMLNTFGGQTTSLIAAIGAAGIAIPFPTRTLVHDHAPIRLSAAAE